MNIELCRQSNHLIYEDGVLWFCYVCHIRTDQAFAYHSQALLTLIRNQTSHKTATATTVKHALVQTLRGKVF